MFRVVKRKACPLKSAEQVSDEFVLTVDTSFVLFVFATAKSGISISGNVS
jgi:hypothetical protein